MAGAGIVEAGGAMCWVVVGIHVDHEALGGCSVAVAA